MSKKVFDGWGCISLRGSGIVRLWGMGGFADGPGSGMGWGRCLIFGLGIGI